MKKLLILLALFLPLPAFAEKFCSTELNICLTTQELQTIQTATEKEIGVPAGRYDGWLTGEFSEDVSEQEQKILAIMTVMYIHEREFLEDKLEEGFSGELSIDKEPFFTPNGQENLPINLRDE